jgi:outer membrane protein assembly factor BamB
MALNKDTGELIWLTDTNRAGYSTPVPTDIDGVPALIMFCRREVAAVTLASGAPIWSATWQTQFDQNCTDPILYDGGVLVSSWTHAGTMLSFRQGQLGTNWQNSQLSSPLSPGVRLGRYLYAFHGPADSGSTITCVDLATGQTQWAVQGYPVGSIISVAGQLVILCGNGALILAAATPAGFQEHAAAFVLSGRCWTLPAFVEGVLYARNAAGDLVALELPWTPGASPSLDIALKESLVIISWPAPQGAFQLEYRPFDPSQVAWGAVTPAPVLSGGRNVVTNAVTGPGRIYRLREQ